MKDKNKGMQNKYKISEYLSIKKGNNMRNIVIAIFISVILVLISIYYVVFEMQRKFDYNLHQKLKISLNNDLYNDDLILKTSKYVRINDEDIKYINESKSKVERLYSKGFKKNIKYSLKNKSDLADINSNIASLETKYKEELLSLALTNYESVVKKFSSIKDFNEVESNQKLTLISSLTDLTFQDYSVVKLATNQQRLDNTSDLNSIVYYNDFILSYNKSFDKLKRSKEARINKENAIKNNEETYIDSNGVIVVNDNYVAPIEEAYFHKPVYGQSDNHYWVNNYHGNAIVENPVVEKPTGEVVGNDSNNPNITGGCNGATITNNVIGC